MKNERCATRPKHLASPSCAANQNLIQVNMAPKNGPSRSSSPRSSDVYLFAKPLLQQSWLCLVGGFLLGHWHGRFFHSASQDTFRLGRASSVERASFEISKNNDGWTSIQVFRGTTKTCIADEMHKAKWHSQMRQDELVFSLLRNKTDGYFVDLAANDAIQLSNTYSLERNWGWNGLCIEPNPIYWHNLSSCRSCETIAAVVGSQRMEEVYFRFEAGDHGGIAGEGFDNGRRWQSRSEKRFTVSLEEILDRQVNIPRLIDYLSLDVEGAETYIMKELPFDRYRFRVITAERLKGEIRSILKSHGYQFVQKLSRWGESLWVHDLHRHEMDFSVIEGFNFPL